MAEKTPPPGSIDAYIAQEKANLGNGGVDPNGASGSYGTSGDPSFNPQTAYTHYLDQYYTDNVWTGQQIIVGYQHAPEVKDGVTPASAPSGLVPAPAHGGGGTVTQSKAPLWATPYQLLADFDHWTHKQYEEFKAKLVAAGLVTDSATPQNVKDEYSKLLRGVVQAQHDHNLATPLDVINNYIRLNGMDPNKLGSGSSGTAKTWSNTATSVYDLTPDNARATLRSALQAKLGRDPTSAEMRDFIDAAQTRATNNPTTSTTTYHTDASGNTTSNTSTDQGFSAGQLQEMALRRAKQAPDYAKYQSASTYYPALVSALGATVS